MDSIVKQEQPSPSNSQEKINRISKFSSIDSSSSSSSSNSSEFSAFVNSIRHVQSKLNHKRNLKDFDGNLLSNKQKKEDLGSKVPQGFLATLPPEHERAENVPAPLPVTSPNVEAVPVSVVENRNITVPLSRGCKQFWKAGDFEGDNDSNSDSFDVGMDHVRVHPKFLHTNATGQRCALGAFAELLDNAFDEKSNGATYVDINVNKNNKDNTTMLLVEDNGGGMTPDIMRQCMSLGYSAKSKMPDTIGQYGNGFKTSTMRLGADVIVFSLCKGKDGKSPTKSIGMLSYTFLRGTRKQDIVVPLIDYEKREEGWNKLIRSSVDIWNRNLETIVQWSPYTSEDDLLQQFNSLKDQGTRIIIYNLWEEEEGKLELDFDTELHDIQIRQVNRDENIKKAERYPSARHFFTYQHSLRSYASILYLRLPAEFRIILRGKEVQHHDMVNDMMSKEKITYKPQQNAEGEQKTYKRQHNAERVPKDSNNIAVGTIGFVKDAKDHIDVQGFNVYHKNRLIKPFWRVWHAAGSDGRGVVGVLEANFVNPAHNKQDFERTCVLERLEKKLVSTQKDYWARKRHEIGYAGRYPSKNSMPLDKEYPLSNKDKSSSHSNQNELGSSSRVSKRKLNMNINKTLPVDNVSEDGNCHEASPASNESQPAPALQGRCNQIATRSHPKAIIINHDVQVPANNNIGTSIKLEENHDSGEKRYSSIQRKRSKRVRESTVVELQNEILQERNRCKELEIQLERAQQKIEELEELYRIKLVDQIQQEED